MLTQFVFPFVLLVQVHAHDFDLDDLVATLQRGL